MELSIPDGKLSEDVSSTTYLYRGGVTVERTLNFYPFSAALITIAAIFAICLFNMHLIARHRRSYFTVCVHAVSLFAVFGLVFHMIGAAISVHPMSTLHSQISQFFFLLSGFSLLGGMISFFALGKKHSFRNLPHNIPDALEQIEAVVFVVDRDGMITHINHEHKYHMLFGKIDHIDQLSIFIKEHCSFCPEEVATWNCLSEAQWELYFDQKKTHVTFQLSPIMINGSPLGYTVVIEDITAIRDSEKKLQEQNESLDQANGKLSNYIKAAGELEAEQERLQILTQIQKTLIQDIETAVSSIRELKQQCFEDHTYPSELRALAAQLRLIYQKVRGAVGQISGKEVDS